MPVESATYINTLVPANPLHTDGLDEADAHPRLIKSVLQNQFPNLGAAAVTATAASINQAAATSLNPGVLEIAANGATGAELKLDHGTGSGDVLIENTGTSGNPGALAVVMNDATNANPLTALTLSRAGALVATDSVDAPAIKEGGNLLIPGLSAGLGGTCVIMWTGTVASIPAGWHLCDGTNGTPDLRNLFIVGAGNTYVPGQTGGGVSAAVTTDAQGSHSHTGSSGTVAAVNLTASTDTQGSHSHGGATQGHSLSVAEMAPHSHNFTVVTDGGTGQFPGGRNGIALTNNWPTDVQGGGAAHTHGITTDGAHGHVVSVSPVPAHAHSISVDGSHTHSATVSTLPPYYALCLIAKL